MTCMCGCVETHQWICQVWAHNEMFFFHSSEMRCHNYRLWSQKKKSNLWLVGLLIRWSLSACVLVCENGLRYLLWRPCPPQRTLRPRWLCGVGCVGSGAGADAAARGDTSFLPSAVAGNPHCHGEEDWSPGLPGTARTQTHNDKYTGTRSSCYQQADDKWMLVQDSVGYDVITDCRGLRVKRKLFSHWLKD